MPNIDNIASPISLIGSGRSGTTLLTQVFRKHPEFQSLGETANVVYSSFHNLDRSLIHCSPDITIHNKREHTKNGIYSTLTGVFPSEKKYWFHKPIHLPKVSNQFKSISDFSEWYWDVSRFLFPSGKFIAVLRNPRDVIVSASTRWGWPLHVAEKNFQNILSVLTHDSNSLDYIIDFEKLVNAPEEEIGNLFKVINIPYHPQVLEAFSHINAANNTNGSLDTIEDLRKRQFRHKTSFTASSETIQLYELARQTHL